MAPAVVVAAVVGLGVEEFKVSRLGKSKPRTQVALFFPRGGYMGTCNIRGAFLNIVPFLGLHRVASMIRNCQVVEGY